MSASTDRVVVRFPAMKAGIHLDVAVDYGQFYLHDAQLGPTTGDDSEFTDDPWLWERRCTASGSAAMVLTMAPHGPRRVEVVVVEGDDAADIEAWDHAAELSLTIRSGRLGVVGWDSSGPVHIVDVPPGNVIVRVLWGGLDEAIRADDDTLEHLRIEVRSGSARTTRVL